MTDPKTPTPADVAAQAAPPTTEATTPPTAAQETPPAQDGTDWKSEARKWEERAKANKDAADQLAALEEANKTEAEKQADLIATLKAKVEDFETRDQIAKWKADVAESTGVPANALAGSSLEEIQAHAETLKPLIAQPPNEPTPTPVVSTVGNQPAPPSSVPLKDQIAAAEEAGDKALVARLKAMQLGAPN